ncbi:MAG: PHP domain-containing protein [Ruminococcaceae bacterium]|nr:PHP domain-containing protein [Oscillospiraceae bacterium]
MNRAELHVHTKLSEDRSVIDPEKALLAAVAKGIKTIAFVDKSTIQAFPTIAKWHRDYADKIQVIYGVETEVEGDRVTLLVRDDPGFKALNQVFTHHRMTPDQREHLLVGAGANSALFQAVIAQDTPDRLRELTGQYDYIELLPHTPEALNQTLYTLGKAANIPVVAVGDCHYLTPEERICKQVLDEAFDLGGKALGSHLFTNEEMLAAFAYLGAETAYEVVMTAPCALAMRVTAGDPYSKEAPPFTLPDAYETVCALCRKAVTERYGANPPEEITQRLEEELSLLQPGTHASLYLLAHKLCHHLRQQGQMTGCRGTLGSTLLAYLLGLSDINPLPAHYYCSQCRHVEFAAAHSGFDLPDKVCPACGAPMKGDGHDLPYEMAMGWDGTREPDVSLNTTEEGHREALRFLTSFLGKGRVAFAGTASRLLPASATGAVADYEKKYGFRFSEEERARIIPCLEGVRRVDQRFPGGLLLLPEGECWENFTPLRQVAAPNSSVDNVTHIHYSHLIRSLSRINVLHFSQFDRLQALYAATGVTPEEVSYNDRSVYRLFEQQDTGGLPEFSTNFMHSVLSRFDAFCFGDLTHINGMTHGTNVWTRNAEDLLEHHPLQELIGTRDDIFHALQGYGVDRETAFAAAQAARLGRFHREHPDNNKLIQTLEQAGVPDWYLQSMRRIHYLFPKAHAAQYTKTAVALAWFKRYYPADFYRVTLQQSNYEESLACTNQELERRLSETDPDYPYYDPDREAILVVLEARRKGYAAEPTP